MRSRISFPNSLSDSHYQNQHLSNWSKWKTKPLYIWILSLARFPNCSRDMACCTFRPNGPTNCISAQAKWVSQCKLLRRKHKPTNGLPMRMRPLTKATWLYRSRKTFAILEICESNEWVEWFLVDQLFSVSLGQNVANKEKKTIGIRKKKIVNYVQVSRSKQNEIVRHGWNGVYYEPSFQISFGNDHRIINCFTLFGHKRGS